MCGWFCLQEVHLLHEFPGDFYGSHLKVVILGFVRPEYNYPSMGQSFSTMYTSTNLTWTVDELIEDINLDKVAATKSLERAAYTSYKTDSYFTS